MKAQEVAPYARLRQNEKHVCTGHYEDDVGISGGKVGLGWSTHRRE
jgi:hypothetical protein